MVGCRGAGGKILGVIHSMWIGEEEDDQLDEMLVTDGDASRCSSTQDAQLHITPDTAATPNSEAAQ